MIIEGKSKYHLKKIKDTAKAYVVSKGGLRFSHGESFPQNQNQLMQESTGSVLRDPGLVNPITGTGRGGER